MEVYEGANQLKLIEADKSWYRLVIAAITSYYQLLPASISFHGLLISKNMTKREKLIIALILIGLGAAFRLLPHLWNFAPIAGAALFAGAYLGRRWGVAVPVLAMILGDLFLGFYEWPLLIVVYGCFILTGLIGSLIKKKNVANVVLASLASSFIFFLATNWAVWQFSPWYAKTFEGLMACFIAALPFFRNTLLGDLFYTGVFFGAYEAVKVMAAKAKFSFLPVKND